MRKCAASLLLLVLLSAACAPPPPTSSPTATPDRAMSLLSKAQTARSSGDRETEALALREAVDLLASRTPAHGDLDSTKAACVQAMVEAGGNAASYRLWSDLLKKKPANAMEAKRMAERARKLMVAQGEELTAQAAVDLEQKRPQVSECTAQAALELFKLAQESGKNLEAAQMALERARKAALESENTRSRER